MSYFKSYFIILTNIFFIQCQQYFPVSNADSSSEDNLKRFAKNLTSNEALEVPFEIGQKFFIKPNTIIRTGESRSLGAKYLNESRLPSNKDCLIWCLETSTCNAAVFEGKNMQSCYLFDCGSPAKPLCKFTAHALFTSSILKMSQHFYELSQWGKEVQLERKKFEHQRDSTSPTPVTTTSTSPGPASTVVSPPQKVNACHHYQFQCVNSSECIAIYNVCDGIPQCPDGSDESTDIKCPLKVENSSKKVAFSRVSPSIYSPGPESYDLTTGFQDIHNKPPEQQQRDYNWPPYSGLQLPKTRYPVEASPFAHNKHSQFISATDPHVRWASDYVDPQLQYEADYDIHPEDLDTSYTAEFSQSGIQKMLGYPTVKESAYARTADDEDHYPESGIGMRKPVSVQDQEDYKLQKYAHGRMPPYIAQQSYPEIKNNDPKQNIDGNSYNNNDLIKASIISQLPQKHGHRQYVSGHRSMMSKDGQYVSGHRSMMSKNDQYAPESHSLAEVKPTTPAKALQRTVLDFKMSVAEVYESSHSHSHEANSAILALVLGISISFLLVLLLACRVKTLGRKMSSRKGRALAHDADYLVNGMYL